MKNIVSIKKKYQGGDLEKLEFVGLMNEKFKVLTDFHENISKTPIQEIIISKNGVIFSINVLKKNLKFYMDPQDIRETPKEVFNFNNYELDEISFLTKLIKDCKVIFDIGSNIGWYSIYLDKFD